MSLGVKNGILLFVGLMALVKSVWGLAAPGSFKKLAAWWSTAAAQVNTLMAVLCACVALILWGVVLINQPLSNWLLALIGLLCMLSCVLYLRVETLQKFLDAMLIQRSPWAIRLLSLVGLAIAVLCIWVAAKGP